MVGQGFSGSAIISKAPVIVPCRPFWGMRSALLGVDLTVEFLGFESPVTIFATEFSQMPLPVHQLRSVRLLLHLH